MRTLHGWDCSCGTRNAPVFTHCRQCGAPEVYGRPVLNEEATPPPVPLRHAPPHAAFAFPWTLAGIIGGPLLLYIFLRLAGRNTIIMVLAVLSLMPWPIILIGTVLWLLVRIASAVERIGR